MERGLVEKLRKATTILFKMHTKRTPWTVPFDDSFRAMVYVAAAKPVVDFARDFLGVGSRGDLDTVQQTRARDRFLFMTKNTDGSFVRLALFVRTKDIHKPGVTTVAAKKSIDVALKETRARCAKPADDESKESDPNVRVQIQLICYLASTTKNRVTRSVREHVNERVRKESLIESVEFWSLQELLYDVTEHCLVPRHRVVPMMVLDEQAEGGRRESDECVELKRRFGRNFYNCLPLIFDTDPVVRFMKFPLDAVIEIERFGPRTQGLQKYYRRVARRPDA